MRRAQKPHVVVFFMGIVAHWTTLVLYNDGTLAAPLMIYLDSRNMEVLNLEYSDILPFIEYVEA